MTKKNKLGKSKEQVTVSLQKPSRSKLTVEREILQESDTKCKKINQEKNENIIEGHGEEEDVFEDSLAPDDPIENSEKIDKAETPPTLPPRPTKESLQSTQSPTSSPSRSKTDDFDNLASGSWSDWWNVLKTTAAAQVNHLREVLDSHPISNESERSEFASVFDKMQSGMERTGAGQKQAKGRLGAVRPLRELAGRLTKQETDDDTNNVL